MIDVEEALSRLPERHQAALRWFAKHTGQELEALGWHRGWSGIS